MFKDQQDQLEQDMAPFGFVVNVLEEENIGEMVDEYGTKWNPIVRQYDTNWGLYLSLGFENSFYIQFRYLIYTLILQFYPLPF